MGSTSSSNVHEPSTPVEQQNVYLQPTRKKGGQVIAFHSASKWRHHFEASKKTPKLMVINFRAAWCGASQSIQSAVDEFASKYSDVEFIKIDVDELYDVADEFNVQAMPMFKLMKGGKEVDMIVGAKKDDLRKKIEKHRPVLKMDQE